MDLEQIFDEISKQMQSDFLQAKNSLTHAGLKGEANEETVRKFLREYLPKTLDISSGTLVDSDGNQSRQLDIIISDAAKTPIFFQRGNVRVIPVECVYAVIEVKAHLDKAELEKAYNNMKSAKSLSKKAFFEPKGVIVHTNTLYGRQWNYWPINHFVFAYDSSDLKSVVKNLDQLQLNDEVHKRIDLICVLNKGVIVNIRKDGVVSTLPEPGSRNVASFTSKPLLFFYTLMSNVLNQANMNYFNLIPYVQKLKF